MPIGRKGRTDAAWKGAAAGDGSFAANDMDQPQRLIIRNMVCDRCRAAVRQVLDDRHVPWTRLELGEVELARPLDGPALDGLREGLRQAGFDLVDDRTAQLIVRAKGLIIDAIHHNGPTAGRVKLSVLLGQGLGKDYSSIAAAFSQVEGITVEQYFLLQRIERVKELVRYGDLTLSEIADRTGFSSVAHLSAQFKKLTGMTPTAFKDLSGGRLPLDRVG